MAKLTQDEELEEANLGSLRPQVYVDPRENLNFTRYHHYVQTHKAKWWIQAPIRFLMWLIGVPFLKIRAVGLENIPESGAVIFAPNHNSFMDHFIMAVMMKRTNYFVAKSDLFTGLLPIIFVCGGTFPVKRGRKDEEWVQTALAVLQRGDVVTIYIEAGRSRSGKIAPREEAGWGVGHLALMTGAPIVPVAMEHTELLRFWNWRQPLKRRPTITVRYGEPVYRAANRQATRQQRQFVAEETLDEIRDLKRTMVRPSGWFREWLIQGVLLLLHRMRKNTEKFVRDDR